MILFYKQNPDLFEAERVILESLFRETVFSQEICGREEVIIVDSLENALGAGQQRPTARIVLLIDDKYALEPDQILDMANSGVSKFANRGDVTELVEKVSKAFHEKKNLDFYIRQEEPMVSQVRGNKVQLEGLINNHIVGKSNEILNVLQVIKTFLAYNEDILVRGENGVGKEVFVNTLLDNLPRVKGKDKCGIMNLGEINPLLFASELFGHKKGAFTGADSNKEGMLAIYDKGVLYLDEIGELPLESQAMLLRVLQNRQYRPVGSTSTQTFDVQIIMATNRDLERMVDEGKFRVDLYHRMKKMVVYVPPLRRRKEDISLLAEAFLSELNNKYPSRQRKMSVDAMNLLVELDWPGNVRELENFVFRAYMVERSTSITLETVKRTIESDQSPKVGEAISNIEKLNSLASKFNLDLMKPPIIDQQSFAHAPAKHIVR